LGSPRPGTRTRKKKSDGGDKVPMVRIYYDDDVASPNVKIRIWIAHFEFSLEGFISTLISREIRNR